MRQDTDTMRTENETTTGTGETPATVSTETTPRTTKGGKAKKVGRVLLAFAIGFGAGIGSSMLSGKVKADTAAMEQESKEERQKAKMDAINSLDGKTVAAAKESLEPYHLSITYQRSSNNDDAPDLIYDLSYKDEMTSSKELFDCSDEKVFVERHAYDSKTNAIVMICLNENTYRTQQTEKKLEKVYPRDEAAKDFVEWIRTNRPEADFISWSDTVVANNAKCVNETTWHCSLNVEVKSDGGGMRVGTPSETIEADVHSDHTVDNIQIK